VSYANKAITQRSLVQHLSTSCSLSQTSSFFIVHRIVDNLPCVTRNSIGPAGDGNNIGDDDVSRQQFEVGYHLGRLSPDGKRAFIYNHLDFQILYHSEDQ